MFTFGQLPTYSGDAKFEAALSEDKRAFTVTFSDGATIQLSKASAPIATKVFSLVIPLEGTGDKAEIEFILQGGVNTNEGTTAAVMLSVNGQSTVMDFAANSDETFVQKLPFAAGAPTECRLSAVLLAGRDSSKPGADAFLNMISIDAELLPRPPQPKGRPQ